MFKLTSKPESVRVFGWSVFWFGCILLLHILMLQYPLVG